MAFDPLFSRVMEFGKNKRPNSGLSNLYVAQTIDQDGNVTSETYGMNTFTNYGFARFFYNNDTWPHNMYIGRGNEVGSFSFLQDPHLIEPITTACDNSRNTTIDYKYPMYFYGAGNLATCVCKFQVSTFNEVVDGISDDVSIYEYGIGSAINELWTHSWVYDISGAQTFITKHMNEKLVITVYFCMTYDISLITSGWNEGRYTVITTLEKFLGARNSNINMTESSVGTYKRYDKSYEYGRTYTHSMLSDNQITKFTNLNEFDMHNQTGDNNGYLDGFYNKTNGFLTMEPQALTTPEAFDIVVQNQFDDFYSTAFADLMGKDVNGYQMPFTQANIQHMYLYDRFAGSYSNPIQYTNNTSKFYGETTFATKFATPIYYTNREEIMTAYVYQNTHPEDAILGFNNSNIGMLYGTNSYWNRGEWVLITTRNSIPQEVQNMKYYITDTNEKALVPIRASRSLEVTMGDGNKDTQMGFDFNGDGAWMHCQNYDHGYIAINTVVWHINASVSFTIGSNLSSAIGGSDGNSVGNDHYCYNDKVVSFDNRNNNIFVTNVATPTNMYSVYMPLYSSGDPEGFTSAINVLTGIYKTESSTGLLGLQGVSQNRFVIMDISRLQDAGSENMLYHRGYNAYMGCAIYSTNNKKRAAYVSTSDNKIYLLDVSGEEPVVEKTFDVPENVTASSITLMFGLNDYFWISNSSTYCYRYHITNNACVSCSSAFKIMNSKDEAWSAKITAVQDVLMIYRCNTTSLTTIYYFRLDEPDTGIVNAYNLTDFETSDSTQFPMMCQLEYLENNTLMLFIKKRHNKSYTVSGVTFTPKRIHIIDFGQWLNPPSTASGPIRSDMYYTGTDDPDRPYPLYPYGKYFLFRNKKIPMIYTMPTRIIGTTKTYSTVNNIKHVSGKQWSITVSNIPPNNYGDSGYPPGSSN